MKTIKRINKIMNKIRNKIKKSVQNILLLLLLLFGITALLLSPILSYAEGGELSTVKVGEATLKGLSKCSHYKVIGTCFWMKCHWYGCDFPVTLKLDHYDPDAIVTVFTHYKSDPWDYANSIIDPAGHAAGQAQVHAAAGVNMADANESTESPRDTNDRFKEVDIIGNPAISVISHLGVFLPSKATSFVPYYQSMVDAAAWRSALTEMIYPASYVPGMREVGQFPINVWGNVYPRNGFLDQPTDSKAAAVIAQRAVDITIHSGQPHVYNRLGYGSCGHDCTVYESKENNGDTKYQMIYPKVEKDSKVFGENDLGQFSPWESDATDKGNGNYAWIMWRHYRGCVQTDGRFLGSITW